jgi:hypothetical protein
MGMNDYSTIGQPGVTEPIGQEISDPPYYSSAENPNCPVTTYICRMSDAALFQLSSNSTSVSAFNGVGYPLSNGVALVGYAGRQSGYAVGQPMAKSGAYTGITAGTVQETCATVNAWNNVIQRQEKMVCQYRANYSSVDGDSGSPVFYYNNGNQWWVAGIHWGAGGYFSMWMHVADEIGNDILARTGQFWKPAFSMGPFNNTTY